MSKRDAVILMLWFYHYRYRIDGQIENISAKIEFEFASNRNVDGEKANAYKLLFFVL